MYEIFVTGRNETNKKLIAYLKMYELFANEYTETHKQSTRYTSS